jgi:cytochrome oxidase Cu insertion factor (SCO1/SenC/PrrC family)
MARKRIAEQTKGIGKPKVGGPFDLVDHNGNRFTNEDMAGKYALVRPLVPQIPGREKIWREGVLI